VRGGNKISRVKWAVVCKEKSQGGLGVCDVRLVNLSLLSKWWWWLLQPGFPLWKEVLIAKYGNHIDELFIRWIGVVVEFPSLHLVGRRIFVAWIKLLPPRIGLVSLWLERWVMVVLLSFGIRIG
jgi:hypothetical protein